MEEFPPGFRFYPTEEELVLFYLVKKLEGNREDLNRVIDRIIPVLDIYDFNPWDLPRNSGEICLGDPEQWFFFIPRQESEARGGRPKRLTSNGYWKATGSPSFVYSSSSSSNNNSESTNVIVGAIGLKKTMVFYTGRAPNGTKTEWKMNEYKAIIDGDHKKLRQEFSLCRVYKKSKCLRAFDRRPHDVDVDIRRNPTIRIQLPAAAPSTHGLGAANHPDNSTTHSTLSISDIPNTCVDVERRRLSSPGSSSSSGDRGEPSQSGQSTTGSCLPMDVDDVEIQWDQFDQDWLN